MKPGLCVVDTFEDQGRRVTVERCQTSGASWYQMRFPGGSVKVIDTVAGRRIEALAGERKT